MQKFVFLLGCVILVVFTVFGFIVKQPCDLDAIYLSCRLTGSAGDIFGTILFYVGSLGIIGLPNLLGIRLMGGENSVGKWPIIFGVVALAGILLVWNT